MARQQTNQGQQVAPRDESDDEQIVEQVGDQPQLVDAAPVVGSAALKSPEQVEAPPVVERFRVVVGGTFAAGGYRAQLRPGKVIDSLNYDVAALRSAGIVLEAIA